MEFATKAAVERVVLFHHDPYHDDADLEQLLDEARARWSGPADTVQLASERMTITLDADGVRIDEDDA
jgi:phosphoribosyl 1,2-cyclic phosphodiesterase